MISMKRLRKTGKPFVFDIKRILLVGTAVYMVLIVAFYFLAGEQLRIRNSRGNIAMRPPESTIGELTAGIVLEQSFSAKIQRMESVSVQWTTYGRPDVGTLTVELVRAADGARLMWGLYDVSTLADYQYVTIAPEKPLEDVYDAPLILRVYADSPAGAAGSLAICAKDPDRDYTMTHNGNPVDCTLCFAASGTDRIWIGLHYWKFAVILWALLALVPLTVWLRLRAGKRSYINNALVALHKYRFLIRQLVSRDFKTKYKRSILGVFWSFLNPLMMMLVQYYVFSTIFKNDVPHFAAYLIIGSVMFNFFSESVGMSLTSILGNAGLITKVYMPKYIYPLTRVLSSLVNLLISLIPMLIVCLFTGVQFQKSAVLALYFMLCLVIFSLGIGLVLSTSMVFFRDTQFLWNVMNMMWMYATPIFYPETILPDNLRVVLNFNPLYHFIRNTRICILDGISPEPMVYIQCMLIALGAILVGAIVFQRNQDKFVLYL